MNHDEFVSVNYVLKEYHMKQTIKKPKTVDKYG